MGYNYINRLVCIITFWIYVLPIRTLNPKLEKVNNQSALILPSLSSFVYTALSGYTTRVTSLWVVILLYIGGSWFWWLYILCDNHIIVSIRHCVIDLSALIVLNGYCNYNMCTHRLRRKFIVNYKELPQSCIPLFLPPLLLKRFSPLDLSILSRKRSTSLGWMVSTFVYNSNFCAYLYLWDTLFFPFRPLFVKVQDTVF